VDIKHLYILLTLLCDTEEKNQKVYKSKITELIIKMKTKIIIPILALLFLVPFVLAQYTPLTPSDYSNNITFNCSQVTNKIPVILGGQTGFEINGNTQLVYSNCLQNEIYVFYNTSTNYVIGNTTTQFPHDIVEGNTTSYNPSYVWSTWKNHTLSMHLEGDITDTTQNQNNGTYIGTPTQTTCVVGDCFDYDGSTEGIRWNDGTFDSTFQTGNYTFMAWANRDNANALQHNSLFQHFKSGQAYNYFALASKNYADQTLAYVYAQDYNNISSTIYTFNVSDDEWNFLVYTYDSANNNLSMYSNGTYLEGNTFGHFIDVNSPYDLAYYDGVAEDKHFDGLIDEVRIINDKVTSSEVNQIYQNYIGTEGYANTQYECITDNDCALCEKCVAGSCTYQTNSEDTKNECNATYNCANDWTTNQTGTGYCDGAGSCNNTNILNNVTTGNVCITGADTNPTNTTYCGIWSDCNSSQCSYYNYYVGYQGDGTSNCNDTDWQVESITNIPDNYVNNLTGHYDNCTLTNTGRNKTYTSCLNDYTRQGADGYCDGFGNFDTDDALTNVSLGNVCIAGADTNPTSGVNCDTWNECLYQQLTADQYYVGYQGDGTSNCTELDWVSTGTQWTAPLGYRISLTENTPNNCSLEIDPTFVGRYETGDVSKSFFDIIITIIVFLISAGGLIALIVFYKIIRKKSVKPKIK